MGSFFRSPLIALFACICPFAGQVFGQKIPPKREFRGAWVATVANIDFPSKQGLSVEAFSEEWTQTLDFLAEAGFNAVFAQVRPAGDAFYRSKISPWSKYLSGKQGMALATDFDPMAFMVEEAHKRNLDFHAWLNPYRASMDTTTVSLATMHPYRHHPEWFLQYGGKMYFNPGLPEVRNYITEIVTEIVMDYEVDGIHFDDYYYPYPSAGEIFPDHADFQNYGFGFASLDEWRRHNVDVMISQVSQMVRLVAPGVQFGVSPFGVWRNVAKDPVLGSPTRAGINAYDDLYADARGWLEKGWVDYVAPQLYWNIGFPAADYELLLKWWKDNAFERQIYIGHAAYKVGINQETAWKTPFEIPRQVALNRTMPGVGGSIFYNTNSLRKNPLGLADSLRSGYFDAPALLPEMTWMQLETPAQPRMESLKLKNGALQFKVNFDETRGTPKQLVVYRFNDRLPGDYNNPRNIQQIIRLTGRETSVLVEDADAKQNEIYTYSVSVTNAQHTESSLATSKPVKVGKKSLKKVK